MRRTKDDVGGVEGGALGGTSGGGRLVGPPTSTPTAEPLEGVRASRGALAVPSTPTASPEFGERLLASLSRLEACARRLTANPADADDLVQATCLRALENWHRFVDGSLADFKKWVVTIMSNLHCDGLRKRQRELLSPDLDDRPDENVPDEAPPWQQLKGESVAAAVSALPELLHAPYILFAMDHLSYAAIAARLNVPPRTVGTRIFRARARLRVALGKELAHAA
jgi:RNA polymerase sigma-70 factor (ECF subfamily)